MVVVVAAVVIVANRVVTVVAAAVVAGNVVQLLLVEALRKNQTMVGVLNGLAVKPLPHLNHKLGVGAAAVVAAEEVKGRPCMTGLLPR